MSLNGIDNFDCANSCEIIIKGHDLYPKGGKECQVSHTLDFAAEQGSLQTLVSGPKTHAKDTSKETFLVISNKHLINNIVIGKSCRVFNVSPFPNDMHQHYD